MYRHLFLKGDSGSGKTTLLLKYLALCQPLVGGFLTQRILEGKERANPWPRKLEGDLPSLRGQTMGFCLLPIWEAFQDGAGFPRPYRYYSKDIPNVFIEKTAGGWRKYPQVFGSAGIQALSRLEGKSVCCLDEIGGIEMQSEPFMKALSQVLEGDLPCVGVIKNGRNLAAMGNRVPLDAGSDLDRDRLEWDIVHRYGGQVVECSGDSCQLAEEAVESFLLCRGLHERRQEG